MTVYELIETTASSPAGGTTPAVPRTLTSLLRRRLLDLIVIGWVAALGSRPVAWTLSRRSVEDLMAPLASSETGGGDGSLGS